MAMRMPRNVMESKFESCVFVDSASLVSAVKRMLYDYDFKESVEGTTLYHRIHGMKSEATFSIQEFSSRILVFSVHDYFSKLEITGFSQNRKEMNKILSGIHSEFGSRIWNFSFKESILVSLPNSALGLLFLVFPSFFFGGVSIESLLVSGFLLQFIIPTLTFNLKAETEKKWKPFTSAKPVGERGIEEAPLARKTKKAEEDLFGWEEGGKDGGDEWFWEELDKEKGLKGEEGFKIKKKKKEEEKEEEISWGHDKSEYGWEGVWD